MKKASKIAAFLAATAFATNTLAADITLKMAHSWPKGFPLFATSVDDYANLVAEMSDGKIKIEVDSRNKHKAAFGIFDFVKNGQYDIGQSASYYYSGKEPDTLFFTTMPFGMSMEVMLALNTGQQMGGWFRKEINSIDDLKGLKMRIPGFGGKVMACAGAVPTNLPPGELFQALERGTLDSLEWVGPSLDLRMGFHKVAPYYYTGWHEPGTELMFFFNKKKMDSLPTWAQSILRNAAKLTGYSASTETFAASVDNWASMKSEYPNIKVKDFPADVIAKLKQCNADLIAEEEKRGGLTAKILASQADYLKKSRAWTAIGDQAYLNNIAK